MLDDGRLTDTRRTVDFSNCVLVMTSNLGSEAIQAFAQDAVEVGKRSNADSNSGDANERLNAVVMGIVAQHFRPEFVNRVDDVVVFRPSDTSAIRLRAPIGVVEPSSGGAGVEFESDECRHQCHLRGGLRSCLWCSALKRAMVRLVEIHWRRLC